MPDFDKLDLDKLYNEEGFYQGHLGQKVKSMAEAKAYLEKTGKTIVPPRWEHLKPREEAQAGMFGGGNTMLILLGVGFITLIGGILFFGKKKRKKAVSYAV